MTTSMNPKPDHTDQIRSLVREVLRFDRFYARHLQTEAKALLAHEVTAPEVVIFRELTNGPGTAAWLAWRLDMDAGYVSRTLALMKMKRYVDVSTSAVDRRRRDVALTELGLLCARALQEFQEERATRVLEELAPRHREILVRAMKDIAAILQRDWVANLIERLRDPA